MITCTNCGDQQPLTMDLMHMEFKWLDEAHTTSSMQCPSCKIKTYHRVALVDEAGQVTCGEFLVVPTHIKKWRDFK